MERGPGNLIYSGTDPLQLLQARAQLALHTSVGSQPARHPTAATRHLHHVLQAAGVQVGNVKPALQEGTMPLESAKQRTAG